MCNQGHTWCHTVWHVTGHHVYCFSTHHSLPWHQSCYYPLRKWSVKIVFCSTAIRVSGKQNKVAGCSKSVKDQVWWLRGNVSQETLEQWGYDCNRCVRKILTEMGAVVSPADGVSSSHWWCHMLMCSVPDMLMCSVSDMLMCSVPGVFDYANKSDWSLRATSSTSPAHVCTCSPGRLNCNYYLLA